jgi:type VI protein secretion system component VasK
LGALWLLCPLLLLRALRLLLLLAPLRLLGTLRLLSALGSLLLLRVLRLLSALRLLALLLLLFLILVLLWSRLRVAKSSGSQQQERKKCGADNSSSFHQVCLIYSLGLWRNISCTFRDCSWISSKQPNSRYDFV